MCVATILTGVDRGQHKQHSLFKSNVYHVKSQVFLLINDSLQAWVLNGIYVHRNENTG